MNNNVRYLINYLANDNYRMAKQYAKIILEADKAQKDAAFVEDYLERLNKKNAIPDNLKGLIEVSAPEEFNKDRFYLLDYEGDLVTNIMKAREAAEWLENLNVDYCPTTILYGPSGTGKTMLVRYIAHILGLPFIRMRFSGIVNSYLGKTQQNIQLVFDYARREPCVLCLDEIDAIGTSRGQTNEVGEMSRVTIALMQEMDNLNNKMLVFGTTNRIDTIDVALQRRFALNQLIKPLSKEQALKVSRNFCAQLQVPSAYIPQPDAFRDGNTMAEVNKINVQNLINNMDAIKGANE